MAAGITRKFELTYFDMDSYALKTTEIEEPNEFAGFESVLERDFNTAGVFFKYSETNIALEFPGTGRKILEDQWQAFGVTGNQAADSDAPLLTVSKAEQDKDFETEYTGRALMQTRNLTNDYFGVEFEEVSLINKIQARKSVRVSHDASEDLDGSAIPSITANPVTFEDREYLGESILQLNPPVGPVKLQLFSWNGAAATYISGMNSKTNTLFYTDQSTGQQLASQETSSNNLDKSGGYVRALQNEFDYNVTVKLTADIDATSAGGPTGDVDIVLVRRDLNSANPPSTDTDLGTFTWTPGSGDLTGETFLLQSVDFLIDKDRINDVSVIKNEQESYQWFFRIDNGLSGGTSASISINSWELSIETTYLDFGSSTIDLYYIFDALEKNIKIIAGADVGLESSFFGGTRTGLASDGCGAYMSETNGYKVRGLDSSVIWTFKQRIESLKAIFNVGWGIERSIYTENLDTVRVEEFDYFFQDIELTSFTAIERDSYSEEYYEPLNISSVVVGYEKYAQDPTRRTPMGTIEDICTRAQYSLPIPNLGPSEEEVGNTARYISEYVASDWLLDDQRIIGIQGLNSTQTSFDEDIFIIDLSGASTIYDDNIVFTSGITRPDSMYNFRLNPRFNFFNHHKVINSVLFRNNQDEFIRTTEYKVNEDAVIAYVDGYDPNDSCLGDTRTWSSNPGDQVAMNSNIQLSDYRSFAKLFEPILIKFRVSMTSAQVDRIIEGHRKGLTDGTNYGYISVTNPEGVVKTGWLISMRFNQADEIGTFELLERNG